MSWWREMIYEESLVGDILLAVTVDGKIRLYVALSARTLVYSHA